MKRWMVDRWKDKLALKKKKKLRMLPHVSQSLIKNGKVLIIRFGKVIFFFNRERMVRF